ncbi:MAG: hypothetical protein LBM93_14275 [Oscillospiraceae bacterium]|nr:hypothetical protein [Oscillospiraceae bacterium]
MSEKVGDSREKGVENYLEEKYGKDFVIERVAFGYFWYYMKDEPQYHYKGVLGNKDNDGEFYKEYSDAFYYRRALRICSDYATNILKEKNINGFVYIINVSTNFENINFDTSVEKLLSDKSLEEVEMYICLPEKTGDNDYENIINFIYEDFSKYNSEIETINAIYIFSDEDFPKVEKYFKESGDPNDSELGSNFTIISEKVICIKNNIINIIK